jgi:hypothetical protein
MVRIPERTIQIEVYLLSLKAYQVGRVLRQMSVAELRRSFDQESAVGRRRWLLIRIKKRLVQLALAEELAAIIRTTRAQGKSTHGRYPLTPRQIEQRIEAKFRLPDTRANRQRIYELTRKLKQRREQIAAEMVEAAAAKGRAVLTKQAQRQYLKIIGDHEHNLTEGSICQVCGEVVGRGLGGNQS